MSKELREKELVALSKRCRKASGKTRAEAAREMGVSQTSIFHAEESPEQSLFNLRKRLVEEYSPYWVVGPFYKLERKGRLRSELGK